MMVGNAASSKAAYQQAQRSAGFCRGLGATLIELSGEDRVSFLHNLCTADIKGLKVGEGCELFFTDVKGRTIGFGYVFASDHSLLLSTAADQAKILLPHLNRYQIREDVQCLDHSRKWQQWALCGPKAESLCEEILGLKIDSGNLCFAQTTWENIGLRCCRTDVFGLPGFLLQIESETADSLAEALAGEASECDVAIFDFLRIRAGSPVFSQDVSPKNFPQEIDRDARAISFNKGCYLGQETIARIDAMGQVHRLLRQLAVSDADPLPVAGDSLTAAGKSAGHFTSVGRNPEDGQIVALGLLRRAYAEPGFEIAFNSGTVKVV